MWKGCALVSQIPKPTGASLERAGERDTRGQHSCVPFCLSPVRPQRRSPQLNRPHSDLELAGPPGPGRAPLEWNPREAPRLPRWWAGSDSGEGAVAVALMPRGHLQLEQRPEGCRPGGYLGLSPAGGAHSRVPGLQSFSLSYLCPIIRRLHAVHILPAGRTFI